MLQEYQINNIRRWAEQGNAEAQIMIGDLYFHGDGVEQDKDVAARWYRKASDSVEFRLRAIVKQFTIIGEDVIEKQARQGNPTMQMLLGDMFWAGEGVEQNYKKAAYCFRKSAKQGYPGGQYRLGRAYYYGIGLKQNKAKAAYWFRKAAKQGYDRAQYILGNMYRYGDGVMKNSKKSIYMYEGAAMQGHTDAQCCLCRMYRDSDA